MADRPKISGAQLGRELGIGRSAVSKLLTRGMPPDLDGARRWRSANLVATRAKSGPMHLPNPDVERLLEARADLAEAKATELRGQLVRVSEARRRWARLRAEWTARVLRIPADVIAAMTAAGIPLVDNAHQTATRLIHETLVELDGDGLP